MVGVEQSSGVRQPATGRWLRRAQHLAAAFVLALGVLLMHGIGGHATPAAAAEIGAASHAQTAMTGTQAPAAHGGCADCSEGLGVMMTCALVMFLAVVLLTGPRLLRTVHAQRAVRDLRRVLVSAVAVRTPSIWELCVSRT